MNVEEYVRKAVFSSLKDSEYETDKLKEGIEAYVKEQAFSEVSARFSDTVTESVMKNNLAPLLEKQHKEIYLFFSNYCTIQELKLIDNKALALAKSRTQSSAMCVLEDLTSLENQFDACLEKVYAEDGLQQMLKQQLSEIILNIDFARNPSHLLSQRLKEITS